MKTKYLTILLITLAAGASVLPAAARDKPDAASKCSYRAGVLNGRQDRQPASCPDHGRDNYHDGYRIGQRLYELDQQIEDLRYDTHDAQDQLRNRSRQGDASGINLELNQLQMRAARLNSRLKSVEAEARKRGSGPLPPPQHEFYYPQ